MAAAPPAAPALRRRPRSLHINEVILDASVRVAARDGWAALTPGHLAEVTGLSRPTVLKRHHDRAVLGAATWSSRLTDPALAAVLPLVKFPTDQVEDPDGLQRLLLPFLRPDTAMCAAMELLLVSAYTPPLTEAVEGTFGALLQEWCTPARGRTSRIIAAQRAFLVGLALGLAIEARRHGKITFNLHRQLQHVREALGQPTTPTPLPAKRAEHLDHAPTFSTGEPSWDAVLEATVRCVGSLGFEAATIEVIAEACGHTRTVIYSRYQNKYELFMDASERMLAQVIPLNMAYQDDLAARVPVTIAETCMVREFMRPERQAMRTITFEQMRLSWHDPRLRKAIRGALAAHMRQVAADSPGRTPESFGAGIMIDVAITNGLALLAQIEPAIWQLPFDTVIVPWRRSQRAATGLAD